MSIDEQCRSGAPRRSRTACHRFGSQNNSLAPESRSPNSSSSVFHQAFNGTTTAPIAAAAHHSTTHSTLFAETMATRSPWPTPNSPSDAAHAANLRVVLLVAQTTIALDEEVDAGVPVRHRDQLAQRVQAVLVHLERDAEDVLGDDLERAARPRELDEDGVLEPGGDLVDGHRGSGVLAGASSCWITSKDQSSLPVPTGPSLLWALCPCWNGGC